MIKTPQNDFERYIRQQWMRDNLQTYALISRLKVDRGFRKEWIQRRIQKEDMQSRHNAEKLFSDFISKLELIPTINSYGKPVIRIMPRRFRGISCQRLLDVDMKHTTTCINLLLEDAAAHIIRGYGIVQV